MEEIKAFRKSQGWTQINMAEYLEIPAITYMQWEQGKRNPPAYVLNLIKYKLKNDTNQIKIDIQRKEYACFSTDKKGITGVFRTTILESVEKWKKNMIRLNKPSAWIETSLIIDTEKIL